MKKFSLLFLLVSFLAIRTWAQEVPPPCGEKGVPDNVPCMDLKTGKLLHTKLPGFLPHQDLPPLPPPAQPIPAPEIQSHPTGPGTKTPAISHVPEEPEQAHSNAADDSQHWSYQENSSCYHDGGAVQCFDRQTLQNYASNQEQFQASFEAGEAAGSAIGLLIRTWIAHHRAVVLERKNIRKQIKAYYDATFDLTDEAMRDQGNLVADFTRLGGLDPVRRGIYERGVANAEAFKAQLALMRPTTEKNLPGILAAKNMNYLQQNLVLAKKFYRLSSNTAEKEDVYSQLIHGLAIYLDHQQDAKPSTTRGPSGH